MSSLSGRSYGRSPFCVTGSSLPSIRLLEQRTVRLFELGVHQLGYRLAFLVAIGQHNLALRGRMVWYLQLKQGNKGAPTCFKSAYLKNKMC